jgi:tetratricopeptide (TPR) repeat protein
VYLAYFGDAAVLAPDWFSLRDALSRLDNNRGGLAANPEFKRAVATGGDAIYLSSLSSLVKLDRKKSGDEVTESGSLKMSNAAWENSYQLSFPKAGWESLFSRFDAKSLASPRELLPRSTLGYIFARPDMQTLWSKWGNEFFGPVTSKNLASIWAMDFDKEVVPEFANEFGAAVLSLPKLDTGKFDAPWVVFLKLKTDKLSRAFSEGKLFKESAAGGRPVKLKIGSSNLVAAIKNGYLVFGPNEAAIGQLDQKEKLYTARDFSRAAERAPPTVVAFGGYSLEAAVAELGTNADPMKAFIINAATSMARAFHSQNFYATETPGGLEARLSVSLDREGRYSVAELQSLSKGFGLTFAVIEARGVPIADQARVETLKVRIRSKAPGVVDRIREDIASPHQTSEKRSENEIVLAVKPRHATPARKVPISEIGSGFEPFLKSTSELRSDDPTVIKQALEIVGADREAWSVARKLSDWTYKNLKWKSVDKADAAQTLATREADCLEFSQLFVAMARSLHLPARIVSGLAYSGGSFGGHAWVEVWAGEWVELDPTWGTDFVDATHIRTAADELIGYAALNLIEVEVLEAPRAVPDFQRSARSFAEKLRDDLSAGTRLSFTLDAVALTDEHMGAGAWSAMTDRDREQISAAYLSLAAGLPARFKTEGQSNSQGRLINVTQNGDRADALLSFNYLTTRFKLGRRGDAWTLLEIVYSASDYHVMHESLQPVIQAIRGRRSGKQPAYASQSAQTQLLVALQNGDSLGKRIPELLHIADEALKEDPKNQTLRHLKALCLSNVENDAKNAEEAVAIWKQLSEEEPPFGPALITLAAHYQIEESKDLKRAIELLQRYAALVPDDPEPHSSLADLYEGEGDLVRAEAARRAEIDRDPLYPDHYTALAELLAVQKRYEEACSAIDEGAKHGQTADVLFADLFQNLYDNDRETVVEGLAAAKPERLNRNVDALITLAEIRVDGGKAGDALPLLKRAVQLAPRHGGAHDAMALAYRTLANWQAALVEADAAIKINAEDGTAHFHRACALAQLGRKTQAIAALKRAIEIDSEVADLLEDTDDLKPLAQMPEFKKLIAPKPEK